MLHLSKYFYYLSILATFIGTSGIMTARFQETSFEDRSSLNFSNTVSEVYSAFSNTDIYSTIGSHQCYNNTNHCLGFSSQMFLISNSNKK